MESLAKLFGNGNKVRLLRYFFLNTTNGVNKKTLSEALLLPAVKIGRELSLLEAAGVLKRRGNGSMPRAPRGARRKKVPRTEPVFMLNPQYPYLAALRTFVIATLAGTRAEAMQAIMRAGTIKLIISSGLFEEQWEGRLDFLIVGEKIREQTLKRALRKTEAELGREIRFAVLTSDEYRYRMSVHDKLIRDVLDYPHTVLLDRRRLV